MTDYSMWIFLFMITMHFGKAVVVDLEIKEIQDKLNKAIDRINEQQKEIESNE